MPDLRHSIQGQTWNITAEGVDSYSERYSESLG